MQWARAWYNKLSRTHSSSWMLECDARKCGGKWNPPFLSVYDEFLILCRGSFHCDGKFCSTYVGILLTTQVPLSEASYSKNACSHQKKYADRHDILEHIRIQRRNIKEKSDGWSLQLLTRTFLQRFMPASNEIQAASSGLVENSFSGGSRNWLRPRLKQCICFFFEQMIHERKQNVQIRSKWEQKSCGYWLVLDWVKMPHQHYNALSSWG